MRKSISSIKFENTQIIEALSQTNKSVNQVSSSVKSLSKKLVDLQKAGSKGGGKGGSGKKSLSAPIESFNLALRDMANMTKFLVIYRGLRTVYDGATEAVSSLIDFKDELIDLRRISGMSREGAEQIGTEIISLAKKYRIALPEMTRATKIWVQQGKTGEDLTKLMNLTGVAMKGLSITSEEASDAMTILMESFKIGVDEIDIYLDKIKAVESKNAVLAKDLVKAYSKAGGAAKSMGVSVDSLNGQVTALTQTLRVSGQYAGNFLKVIYMKIQRPAFIGHLKEAGIVTKETMSGLLDVGDILDMTAASWDQLSSSQQTNIAFAAGGRRRYSEFLSLMQNYDLALKATRDSLLSFNDSNDAAKVTMQKFSSVMQDTKNTLLQTADALEMDKAIKGLSLLTNDLAGGFNGLTKGMSSATTMAVGLGTAITGLAAIIMSGGIAGVVTGLLGKGVVSATAGFLTKQTVVGLGTSAIFTGVGLAGLSMGKMREKMQEEDDYLDEAIDTLSAMRKKTDNFNKNLEDISTSLASKLIGAGGNTVAFKKVIQSSTRGISEELWNSFYEKEIKDFIDKTESWGSKEGEEARKKIAKSILGLISIEDYEIEEARKKIEDQNKKIFDKTRETVLKLKEDLISSIGSKEERRDEIMLKPPEINYHKGFNIAGIIKELEEVDKLFEGKDFLEAYLGAINSGSTDIVAYLKDNNEEIYNQLKSNEILFRKLKNLSDAYASVKMFKMDKSGKNNPNEKNISLTESVERYLSNDEEEINNFLSNLIKHYDKLGLIPEKIGDLNGFMKEIASMVGGRFMGGLENLDSKETTTAIAENIKKLEIYLDLNDRILAKGLSETQNIRKSTEGLKERINATIKMNKLSMEEGDQLEHNLTVEKLRQEISERRKNILALEEQIKKGQYREEISSAKELLELDKKSLDLNEKKLIKAEEDIKILQEQNDILSNRKSILSDIGSFDTSLDSDEKKLKNSITTLKINREYTKVLKEQGEYEANISKIRKEAESDISLLNNEYQRLTEEIEKMNDKDKIGKSEAKERLEEEALKVKNLIELIKILADLKIGDLSTEKTGRDMKSSFSFLEDLPTRIRDANSGLKSIGNEINGIYEKQKTEMDNFSKAQERYSATGSSLFLEDMQEANSNMSALAESHNELVSQQDELNDKMNIFKQAWTEISDTIKTKFIDGLKNALIEIVGIEKMIGEFTNFALGKSGKTEVSLNESGSDIKKKGKITGETIARILVNSQVFTGSGGRTGSAIGEIGGALGLFGKFNPVAGMVGGIIGSLFDKKSTNRQIAFTGEMGTPEVQNNTSALIENTSELRKMNEELINAPSGFKAPKLLGSSSGASIIFNISGLVGNDSALKETLEKFVNESLTTRLRMS